MSFLDVFPWVTFLQLWFTFSWHLFAIPLPALWSGKCLRQKAGIIRELTLFVSFFLGSTVLCTSSVWKSYFTYFIWLSGACVCVCVRMMCVLVNTPWPFILFLNIILFPFPPYFLILILLFVICWLSWINFLHFFFTYLFIFYYDNVSPFFLFFLGDLYSFII